MKNTVKRPSQNLGGQSPHLDIFDAGTGVMPEMEIRRAMFDNNIYHDIYYKHGGDYDVYGTVQQLGDAVLLAPKESVWKIFMGGLEGFMDDIFDGGRDQDVPETRERL